MIINTIILGFGVHIASAISLAVTILLIARYLHKVNGFSITSMICQIISIACFEFLYLYLLLVPGVSSFDVAVIASYWLIPIFLFLAIVFGLIGALRSKGSSDEKKLWWVPWGSFGISVVSFSFVFLYSTMAAIIYW
jgi:hypothetical protein